MSAASGSIFSPKRWQRSTWVVTAVIFLTLLMINLPGEVVSFPRIELPNSLQSGFPIDWRYEHGWPWTYLVRAEFDHTFMMHMPMPWDEPSSADCWKLWSDLPRLQYAALIGNVLIAAVLMYGSGAAFEWWRRRRNRIWQLHLVDVFLLVAVLSTALAKWISLRDHFVREQQTLSLPMDPTVLVDDGFPFLLIESHSVQRGGPSWIRLLSEESPLSSFDRVIEIEVQAYNLTQTVAFKNLRRISTNHEATNSDLATLSQFHRLEALRLTAVTVDRDDESQPQMVELPAMPKLRGLSLSHIRQQLAGISKLQSLEVLEIDECTVTDAMLDELGRLKRLRELSLAETRITSEGLERLSGLTQLEKLVLDDTLVDDSGLSQLCGLPQLNDLSLDHTAVSGVGLRHLIRLPNLQTLSLIDTEITDADIVSLKEFPRLKSLSLSNRRLSEDGITQVRRALPSCEIHVLNTRQGHKGSAIFP